MSKPKVGDRVKVQFGMTLNEGIVTEVDEADESCRVDVENAGGFGETVNVPRMLNEVRVLTA